MRAWQVILGSTVALVATPLAARQQAAPGAAPLPAQTAPPPAAATDEGDIVVEGYRLRKDVTTAVKYPTAISTIRSRRMYDAAQRMATCAARSRLSDLGLLRRVIDGEVNSAAHAYAQDRLTRTYATCGLGSDLLLRRGPLSNALDATSAFYDNAGLSPNIEAFPLGHSVIDRGAYVIAAMKRFTPDLTLTRADVADPEVRTRFALRESARNRFRFPVDRTYFDIASCMVQQQPRLAVRLAVSDGPASFGDVQAALIDRAGACVGGIKDVQVDPSEFRVYIADAVYRWAVAARNVASLIPPDAERGG